MGTRTVQDYMTALDAFAEVGGWFDEEGELLDVYALVEAFLSEWEAEEAGE